METILYKSGQIRDENRARDANECFRIGIFKSVYGFGFVYPVKPVTFDGTIKKPEDALKYPALWCLRIYCGLNYRGVTEAENSIREFNKGIDRGVPQFWFTANGQLESLDQLLVRHDVLKKEQN